MNLSLAQNAVDDALKIVRANAVTFGGRYPDDTTEDNVYRLRRAKNGFVAGDNYGWTTGFWPGVLWLAEEFACNGEFRGLADEHAENFITRIEQDIDLDTHDIGFLYTLTCVAPWRLNGNLRARDAAVKASHRLMQRYLEKIGVFQAWGTLDDPQLRGNTIIDSLMNMPLLYWAAEITGESHFAQAAHRHSQTVSQNIIRPNNTTFHTFYWDIETGAPLRGQTAQGYSDGSCWARGQAWGIYGFALNYRYTRDASFIDSAVRCADYFLDHLPADHVPYWDMVFGEGSGEERDSSSAAIAVCGLHELVQYLDDDARIARYKAAADAMLTSLIENYTPRNQPEVNTLILHSVYDKPKMIGVDEGTLWGDYFYMEALMRTLKPDWQLYW